MPEWICGAMQIVRTRDVESSTMLWATRAAAMVGNDFGDAGMYRLRCDWQQAV